MQVTDMDTEEGIITAHGLVIGRDITPEGTMPAAMLIRIEVQVLGTQTTGLARTISIIKRDPQTKRITCMPAKEVIFIKGTTRPVIFKTNQMPSNVRRSQNRHRVKGQVKHSDPVRCQVKVNVPVKVKINN